MRLSREAGVLPTLATSGPGSGHHTHEETCEDTNLNPPSKSKATQSLLPNVNMIMWDRCAPTIVATLSGMKAIEPRRKLQKAARIAGTFGTACPNRITWIPERVALWNLFK